VRRRPKRQAPSSERVDSWKRLKGCGASYRPLRLARTCGRALFIGLTDPAWAVSPCSLAVLCSPCRQATSLGGRRSPFRRGGGHWRKQLPLYGNGGVQVLAGGGSQLGQTPDVRQNWGAKKFTSASKPHGGEITRQSNSQRKPSHACFPRKLATRPSEKKNPIGCIIQEGGSFEVVTKKLWGSCRDLGVVAPYVMQLLGTYKNACQTILTHEIFRHWAEIKPKTECGQLKVERNLNGWELGIHKGTRSVKKERSSPGEEGGGDGSGRG